MAATTSIVLVHGAWHGAWCWEPFEPALRTLGMEVVPVELTSHGRVASEVGDFHSDVELVRRIVSEISGPVALLGHSYGGVVITEAAAGLGNVVHLIYQSAFVPVVGDSMFTLTGGGRPPWLQPTDDGLLAVMRGWPTKLWYSDCDAERAAWAEDRLQPQSARSFQQPVTAVGWKTIPSTYIVCSNDQAVLPEGQRTMARRIGAKVVELPTGHSPFLVAPERVAALVADILH